MKTEIFLGVDMGSTGLKAVAFELGSGATLAAAGGALPHRRSPDGGQELSSAAIRDALMQSLRSVAAQLGPRVAQVAALCCTGHGAGLYALDEHGHLLRDAAAASTDQRAAGRARVLAQRMGSVLFEEVGCGPWAGQPTLVAAELVARGALDRHKIRHLLFAKDYLAYLLTGALATDPSDVSTGGLLSLSTGKVSTLAFEAADLADLARTLPPILPSGAVVGHLQAGPASECGLPAGLPVAMGAIDLLASLTAVGAPARGQAVAVLGTWCVNAVVAPVREPKPPVVAMVHFGTPDQRLYLENSPSSMANVSWLARTLQFSAPSAVVEAAMTVPLGADGLRFAPFVNGGGFPPNASAGFIGLASHHTRAHMARAVVDAVVALHARHLSRLAALGLGQPESVAALGGGARDARVAQLLAGLLGHPVERCGDDETGARGAALYAVLSQGGSPDALPAARQLVEPARQDAQRCADFRASFAELIERLAPAFELLASHRP